ncbi:MAG: M3 family oligoendopeptidase [Balneolaceae bacterium]
MSTGSIEQRTGAEQVEWNLSDLYESPADPALDKDRADVLKEADHFARRYRNRVSELSGEEFLESVREYEGIVQKMNKIGSYSHLYWSVNTEDAARGKLMQEASELGSEVSQKLVFYDVEWLKIDEKKARKWIESEEMKPYRHYLTVSRLYKDHTLSEGEEQVMSAKSVTGRSAWNRFFDETMGAARFRIDGEELTQQQALSKLHSSDRELRKKAHSAVTKTLSEKSRTLTFIFNTVLADKYTSDRLRGYDSWISSRNISNQIDEDSVEALIDSVTGSYGLVQRYYRLKKDLLGYDRLYDYDRYAPVDRQEKLISWDEAREMVIGSFGDFHPAMARVATRFFDERWIDAAIKPGKRGGAYSASTVASVHPYVFLNYDGQLRDVQTLAHELGHGVHQFLSRKQGELQSGTPLTTAETASVFAEMLVFEKLLAKLDKPEEKLGLLISKIDDTVATVFRQISMNRFEDAIHTIRRTGGELSTSQFSENWHQTQKDLYGDSIQITDDYRLWWSYIPHFLHTPGYVYAYAFGELLVLALYQSYRESGDGFAERYLEMLEAGGSDWPHNLVAGLNMDIKDPSFWQKGLNIFSDMVERAEKLKSKIDETD